MNDSPTILLVDDTLDVLLVLGDLLECENYTVLYAKNSERAIQRALSMTPGLTLLDNRMLCIHGDEKHNFLKNMADLRGMPSRCMSRHLSQGDGELKIVQGLVWGFMFSIPLWLVLGGILMTLL